VAATADTRALGYARPLKRLMMERGVLKRGVLAEIATLHDGYTAGRGIDHWPVFGPKGFHYAEDAVAAAIAERVRHEMEGPTRESCQSGV
jgi:hypothetical protein